MKDSKPMGSVAFMANIGLMQHSPSNALSCDAYFVSPPKNTLAKTKPKSATHKQNASKQKKGKK